MTEHDAAVLAAFRQLTGWSDELVLHYAACQEACDPTSSYGEYYCPEARQTQDNERTPR